MTDKLEGGETVRIFESGSILQYLVDRYDTDHKISYPRGTKEYYEMNNWVFHNDPDPSSYFTEYRADVGML